MALLRRSFQYFPLSLFQKRLKTTYIVLLPEYPEDTPESNPLLSVGEELPDFGCLSAEKCYSGIGKLCLEYESGVWAVEDKAKDPGYPKSFANIVEVLDKLDVPLSSSWSAVKTLYTVRNDQLDTVSYLKIHERARKARAHKFRSQGVYEACKHILATDASLSDAQRRVVQKFILEGRLNGIELEPDQAEALHNALKKLEEQKHEYKIKLMESRSRFSYRISDRTVTQGFPENLLKEMSLSKNYLVGPWEVTLLPHIYEDFLKYCPSKELRFNLWKANVMQASNYISRDVSNSVQVEEIRFHRRSQANILGYETFAQMSMETKMAGSVENVLSMITSLIAKAKKVQQREVEALQKFAAESNSNETVDACDVPFWRNKMWKSFCESDTDFAQYFPFEHVWMELLQLVSNLFGVSFEEVPSSEVPIWHPDVRFFRVHDKNGGVLSHFYLDPFKRPGQKLQAHRDSAWMLPLRTQSTLSNMKPVASLLFNFDPPDEKGISLLSFDQVKMLFKKFGHSLQHLLTTVPYSEASGLTNVEWDAVELCSNFMQNWLYEPSVLEKISSHCESGLPLTGGSISDIIRGRTLLSAYDLCRELYLSHLDLQLYSSKAFWRDVVDELWDIYNYFPLDRVDAHPCSFHSIMSDVWAAAYYSHTWARMLAADAFQAFKECDPEDIPMEGKRFRDTFLSLGGGCHPSEVFRKFRGRDPTPEALLSHMKKSFPS